MVNGIERAVINQIVRSPGAYFSGELDAASGRVLYTAEVRPLHGSWLEFEVTRGDVIYARIDRRRKVLATTFFELWELRQTRILIRLLPQIDKSPDHKYIAATLAKDPAKSREEALIEIYRKMRPGEPAVLDNAETLFASLFTDGRRYDLGKSRKI